MDETIAEEVSKCEKSAGKFKLVDLLTVPMQRILKYHMLLQRLVGQTASHHEEYHSIQQAYDCMLDVSEYINEVKRDSEQLDLIKAIQSSITDWNIQVRTKNEVVLPRSAITAFTGYQYGVERLW